jgi:polyhydroxyalkanoate synthesis regulator phasin
MASLRIGEEMREEMRRIALFGSGIAELSKTRAEKIVKDLVKAGDVRRKNASGVVKELLETSRDNRRELVRILRAEVKSQIEALGVATTRDLERLEQRVARLEARTKTTAKKTTRKLAKPTARSTTPRKTAGRKTTARKTSARRGSHAR